MLKPYLIIIILFISIQVQSQSEKEKELFSFIKTHQEQDSTRLKALIQLSNIKLKSNKDSSQVLIQEAMAIANLLDLEVYMAKAYNVQGIIHRRNNKYDSALLMYQKANDIFETNSLPLLKAGNLISIANILKAQNQLDSAMSMNFKAHDLFSKGGHKSGTSYSLKGIGDIFFLQDDYKKCLDYYKRSLANLDSVKNKYGMSVILGGIGACYVYLKKYDSSFIYVKQSIKIKKALNDSRGLAFAYNNMASNYGRLDRLDSAIYYQNLALEIQKKFKNQEDITLSYINLASFSLSNHNLIDATRYSDQSIEIATSIKNVELLKKCYKYKFRIDSAKNNYPKAFENLKKYILYKDSIINIEKTKTITNTQTKYETQIKEQEIKDLTTASQIQELKFSQQKLIYSLIIGGVIILALIILFVYYNNKSKAKQATIDFEQKLLRNQLNPHFIFNALGAIQNFMLKNDAPNAGIYLSKFSKLMRQILEHSREDFISVEEEVEMLQNYLDIQKARFQESFNYAINVDSSIDIETTTIPPMFAQPFLENAIEHGIADMKDRGNIEVAFSKSNDIIHLEITDNGKGITEASHENKKHKSLATIITKERMSLFGNKIRKNLSFAIENMKDSSGSISGTKVRLDMPCLIVD